MSKTKEPTTKRITVKITRAHARKAKPFAFTCGCLLFQACKDVIPINTAGYFAVRADSSTWWRLSMANAAKIRDCYTYSGQRIRRGFKPFTVVLTRDL